KRAARAPIRCRRDPDQGGTMTTSSSAEVPGQVGSRPSGARVSGGVAGDSLLTEPPQATAWAGYLLFAATMLILIGCLSMVTGFVGIFKDRYFVVPSRDL